LANNKQQPRKTDNICININPKPIEKGEDSHIDAGYVSGDTVLGGAK